jgi:tripartite-type tricarboxylate transporter receptor subunit TctC
MKENFLKNLLFILLTITWTFIIPQYPALAQSSFPTKPVTIWVGFPAGGGTDIIIRALAEGSEKSLEQKIVVMNKPGGGGTVGASLLIKEKPDGYTLGASTDTPFTRAPHLRDLSYDPLQDFSFILRVGKWKNVFVVRSDSPFKTWQDLVDWAKKNPGQLIHGNPGAGTSNHLAMVKVALKEGFTYKNVPFAGDTPNVSALLGGHVMVASGSSVAWQSHVEAKAVRVLLVIEREGLDYVPDAPTFEKVGYDFEMSSSIILYGPKGILDPVRGTLEKAFLNGMRAETFKTVAKNQGLSTEDPLTGKDLHDYLRKWNTLYEQYIKEAGLYKMERK